MGQKLHYVLVIKSAVVRQHSQENREEAFLRQRNILEDSRFVVLDLIFVLSCA